VADASTASALASAPPTDSAWDRYWFGEASLVRLAVFRIVMLLTALLAVRQNQMSVFEHADELVPGLLARSWHPIYAFEVLGLEPLDAVAARIVWVALWISIWMGVLGIWTRVSCAVAAALTFVWIGTSYSFGKPHHDCVPLMFGLVALPLAPVGARLSVDAWLARIRRTRRGADPAFAPEAAPWAALPWRVTQIAAAIGYFFSGASKLAIGGFAWVNGYTLQGIMLEFNAPWTATFAANVLLCRAMSIGLLFVQTTFPLVFLSKRLRWFYVPMAVAFHVMSWQTMSTGTFAPLWLTLASFLELQKVPSFLRRHWSRGPLLLRAVWVVLSVTSAGFIAWIYLGSFDHAFEWSAVVLAIAILIAMMPRARLNVIYDGDCGICRATMASLKSFDWSRRIDLLDLRQWESVTTIYPELDAGVCARDLHAVTAARRVLVGYDAYRAIVARLPLFCCLAPIMALPGISHVGRRIYRHVADNRRASSCSAAAK